MSDEEQSVAQGSRERLWPMWATHCGVASSLNEEPAAWWQTCADGGAMVSALIASYQERAVVAAAMASCLELAAPLLFSHDGATQRALALFTSIVVPNSEPPDTRIINAVIDELAAVDAAALQSYQREMVQAGMSMQNSSATLSKSPFATMAGAHATSYLRLSLFVVAHSDVSPFHCWADATAAFAHLESAITLAATAAEFGLNPRAFGAAYLKSVVGNDDQPLGCATLQQKCSIGQLCADRVRPCIAPDAFEARVRALWYDEKS